MPFTSIFSKSIPGVRSSVQVTQGSVENLNLLEAGDGELAFSLGDTLSAAWNGNADAGFKARYGKLRGVAAIYRNHIQLVVSESSGAKTLLDLKGKRVSVGPQTVRHGVERTRHLWRRRHDLCGLRHTDYLPFGQSAKMIEKGELDATLQSAGLGVDSIRHLSTAVPIRLVAIPKDTVMKIGDPAYLPSVIPTRT